MTFEAYWKLIVDKLNVGKYKIEELIKTLVSRVIIIRISIGDYVIEFHWFKIFWKILIGL